MQRMDAKMGGHGRMLVMALVLVGVVGASVSLVAATGGSVMGTCSASHFEVSQLRPLVPGPPYLRQMLGASWGEAIHESNEVLTQRKVSCRDTFPYLWKVQFNGDMEGAVTALARFEVAGDISESITFGKVINVDLNYGDEQNVPAVQPTVNVVVEEVEKPDASYPEGKYVKLTASGLLSGSTAVFRIDLKLDCSRPNKDGITEEQREAAMVEYVGEIIDAPRAMCAETIETDSRGMPTLPFGDLSLRMSMPAVVMRQGGPVRGFTSLSVFVKPCPGLNCGSDCSSANVGTSGFSFLGNTDSSAGFGGISPVSYTRGECTPFLFCYIWEGVFELSADYVFFNVTNQEFRVNQTNQTLETLRDIDSIGYWGFQWVTGAPAFDPQFAYDYFNVGPSGDIQYFGFSVAFIDASGATAPIISNDVVGVFVPDSEADCDCILTGNTVPTLNWSCGPGATTSTSDVCTNSAGTFAEFRCIESGEVATGDCFLIDKDTCTLSGTDTQAAGDFRCNVLSGPLLTYFPFGEVCTNPAISPRF